MLQAQDQDPVWYERKSPAPRPSKKLSWGGLSGVNVKEEQCWILWVRVVHVGAPYENEPPEILMAVRPGEVLEPGMHLSGEGRERGLCPYEPGSAVGGSRGPNQEHRSPRREIAGR